LGKGTSTGMVWRRLAGRRPGASPADVPPPRATWEVLNEHKSIARLNILRLKEANANSIRIFLK
jgi:hypothetical protein